VGEILKSITERALSDVFLNGMVTMIRTGVPERDAMIATLTALSDALREMTKRAVRVAETTPPSVVIHGTPPGHVLVGMEARERIAEANRTAEKQRNLDCTCGDQGGGPCVTCRGYDLIVADAVLAALGVRGGA